jgi:hypothetical protein
MVNEFRDMTTLDVQKLNFFNYFQSYLSKIIKYSKVTSNLTKNDNL